MLLLYTVLFLLQINDRQSLTEQLRLHYTRYAGHTPTYSLGNAGAGAEAAHTHTHTPTCINLRVTITELNLRD